MLTALLSVWDKTGLAEFASGLHELGWRLLASGRTARALAQAGLPATEVAEYAGSPEMLGGRVKTLHPAIHGGLLARDTHADRAELARFGWSAIDLLAVNLYPFEKTVERPGVALEEALEQIDIGGVALLRAGAKNHSRVAVLSDPADYAGVLAELRQRGATRPETRRRLALKAFRRTTAYDAAISDFLAGLEGEPAPLRLTLQPILDLRYGENPHQRARLYGLAGGAGPLGGNVLQGKELSYNNLLDLDAAWRAALSFDEPTIVIVKHLSPCGIASAPTLAEAFRLALACDPVSAFGGVIAANRPFDAAAAHALGDLFVECLAAPAFEDQARAGLARRRNLRLLAIPDLSPDFAPAPAGLPHLPWRQVPGNPAAGARIWQSAQSGAENRLSLAPDFELRSVRRGVLWQTVDAGDPPDAPQWRIVTRRAPGEAEWQALRFAWRACRHVRSNAIVLARGAATVGIGGGQPNRVDCVRIAGERAGERARGAVMASDAFFPFPDGVEAAARLGVSAVVQPGGSVQDREVIAAADRAGMAMVFTGVRHFRH